MIGACNSAFPFITNFERGIALLSDCSQYISAKGQPFGFSFTLCYAFALDNIDDYLNGFFRIPSLGTVHLCNEMSDSTGDIRIVIDGRRESLDVVGVHDLSPEETELEDNGLNSKMGCLLMEAFKNT